jgi:hypothetical protein
MFNFINIRTPHVIFFHNLHSWFAHKNSGKGVQNPQDQILHPMAI